MRKPKRPVKKAEWLGEHSGMAQALENFTPNHVPRSFPLPAKLFEALGAEVLFDDRTVG